MPPGQLSMGVESLPTQKGMNPERVDDANAGCHDSIKGRTGPELLGRRIRVEQEGA